MRLTILVLLGKRLLFSTGSFTHVDDDETVTQRKSKRIFFFLLQQQQKHQKHNDDDEEYFLNLGNKANFYNSI